MIILSIPLMESMCIFPLEYSNTSELTTKCVPDKGSNNIKIIIMELHVDTFK